MFFELHAISKMRIINNNNNLLLQSFNEDQISTVILKFTFTVCISNLSRNSMLVYKNSFLFNSVQGEMTEGEK